MADLTIADINTQFDDLQAAVVKEQADVTNYVQGLKDKIAAGGTVTQADLQALSTKISGVKDMVTQFDINTTAAPVTPEPLPPVA